MTGAIGFQVPEETGALAISDIGVTGQQGFVQDLPAPTSKLVLHLATLAQSDRTRRAVAPVATGSVTIFAQPSPDEKVSGLSLQTVSLRVCLGLPRSPSWLLQCDTLKELSKAIKDFIVEPTVPLPDDLVETIAAYLRRHQKYDEAASDRLQEELMLIFDKYVRGNPATSGAWMGIMRRLLPVLQTPERILAWFDACRGLLDKTDHEKNIVNETIAALMDVVTLADEYHEIADDDSASNPFIDRLFTTWLDKFYPAYSEGNATAEHNERMLRDALGHFGRKRPKEFFASLNSCFIKKQYRKATLRFFCDYLQSQPPHLHQIMQTPLFTNLLTCLQQDTSTTVISAALTALIMLLPHMPSSLVPHLPTLFNIYARLLFWERERSGVLELPSHDSEQASRWEICSFEPETEDVTITHLSNYYTILYGLYPINFMDYIRKPQRYMRHANVSNPDEIEVQPTEIRHQSEQFRRCHVLHPNLYTLTIESEKTDFGRWIKSEAAEVVAECMSLCLAPETQHFVDQELPHLSGPSIAVINDDSDRVRSDPGLLSSSVTKVNHWRNAHLSSTDSIASDRTPSTMMRRGSLSSQRSARDSGELRFRETTLDSPTLPPQLAQSASHTQLQDMIKSNKVIKSSLHQSLANDSVPSLALSHQDSVADRPPTSMLPPPQTHSPASVTDGNAQIAHLQRQILLLQNDLSFERYLKQQHMAHIGELRRRQMVEAATEAETQNLILMNRNLKSRYEEAKMAETQVRKESEKSRALAKKWEADLANKVKTLREDSKKTHAELENARRELEESRREGDKLRRLVCDAEVKELNARQNMQSIEIHGAEIDRLKAEVNRLTRSERDNQAREVERQTAVNSAKDAQNQVEALKLKLAAAESEVQRTKKLFQTQVASLQGQISTAQEERDKPGSHSIKVLESALTANRAKQAEQEKQYKQLSRKYTALQSSLFDMQSEATVGPPRQQQTIERPRIPEPEMEYLSTSASMAGSPMLARPKPRRLLSDAEIYGTTAYSVTPSLGSNPPTPTSAVLHPLQQTVSAGPEGPDSLSMSPDSRYFSGGFGSKIRKESKDRQKDDNGKPKKEKRSTAFRGIRGFVNNS
ncbi:Tuberous sclerosis 1homolog-like-like protein [Cladobotryum mycophilum]|uniref:Tuberous sclerosis 1homolog-like-like protein n=1 Tax=Cladobotryum mycophilum TaxID=491253 RepID=A0ABR0T1G2_9HYPO